MDGPRPPRPPRKPQELYPKPKNIREVPHYLRLVIGGFFYRLFYIIGLVWETNPALMIALALLCISTGVLPVVGALISKDLLNAVNDALMTHDIYIEETLLVSITGTMAAVALYLFMRLIYMLVNRLLNRIQNTVDSIAGELVSNHIKVKIMNKAKMVDLASFDNPEFYEKMENATREAGMRPIHILTTTFHLISAIISSISFFVILCTIGWQVPAIMIVIAIPTAIVNYIFRNRNFWYVRHHSLSRRQMSYFSGVVTNKDLVKEMRLMNLSDSFIDRYKKAFQEYYMGLKKLILQEAVWQVVVSLISIAAETALFFYIAYSIVFSGTMKIGDYSLLTGALSSVSNYVTSIIGYTATLYEGTLFIENLMTFMKEDTTILKQKGQPTLVPQKHVPHTLVFEHVSFRYPGIDHNVITDFNCTMKSGERVVLVGLNGAGKTTLIKLLTRLYDPTEGRILLDGHDLREYDPKALYKLYGAIFQDFGKYALTVGENIALGNLEEPSTEDSLQRAATMGDATFIQTLPDGMNTPLMRIFEDTATDLSIGQWQKLSIARAFYADSDILILDEPTASLDAIAEQEIYDRFAELSKNKLTLLVSHRLSSAVTATKIVVLDGGTLTEEGSHEELMRAHGTYYKLFSTQAKNYQTHENLDLVGDHHGRGPHGGPPPMGEQPDGMFPGDFPEPPEM